jgi:peptide-methionine (R)-S-oxide reductase
MENKKLIKSDEEWKKILTPEQFEILRKKGTEMPASYNIFPKKSGAFYCIACDNKVFLSKDKFDSGTGWPSFTKPATDTSVEYLEDNRLGMTRTEVLCWRCEGHLGHVFDDGPTSNEFPTGTGKRFCINGVVLKFKEDK